MPVLAVITLMATSALIDPLALDLEVYVPLLVRKHPLEIPTEAVARSAAEEYKRFMAVVKVKKNMTSQMQAVPPRLIDLAWHEHIIDTEKYAADCQRVFGYYIHHLPTDPDTPEKTEEAEAGYSQTVQTYTELFGEPSKMWLRAPNDPKEGCCVPTCSDIYCEQPPAACRGYDDRFRDPREGCCVPTCSDIYCEQPAAACRGYDDRSPHSIESVADHTRISAYELDLSRVRTKLNKERPNSVIGEYYRNDTIERGLREYRDFLAGVQESPSAVPSVSELVNYVWEFHILHTSDYRRDCTQLFGSFLHHSHDQVSEDAVTSAGWSVSLSLSRPLSPYSA